MSTGEIVTCPRCGSPATELLSLDPGTRGILEESQVSGSKNLPSQVCKACLSSLTGMVSKGAKLRIEQQARQKNKHMLWKSRVNLVKQARAFMTQKAYSDAAVTYEKYIRVLEISYDLKKGSLSPDVFGKSSKSKELTVVATAYWDLMRIYDLSPRYRDRMTAASHKLAEFLPFSPIFPDVIKKAQEFAVKAKNPDVVRGFLKLVKASSTRCFVVTASYGDPSHPMVNFYRSYRDDKLMKHPVGRFFIQTYYWASPPLAKVIAKHPSLQFHSRQLLDKLHQKLSSSYDK